MSKLLCLMLTIVSLLYIGIFKYTGKASMNAAENLMLVVIIYIIFGAAFLCCILFSILRSSFNYQMQERAKAEEAIKQL